MMVKNKDGNPSPCFVPCDFGNINKDDDDVVTFEVTNTNDGDLLMGQLCTACNSLHASRATRAKREKVRVCMTCLQSNCIAFIRRVMGH